MKTLTALSIGSNLGDRGFYIDVMEYELRSILVDVKTSPLMETEPVGIFGDPQSLYLNKIVAGCYAGTARELLAACLAIESSLGRRRGGRPKTARTADVDILLFGDTVIDEYDAHKYGHTLVVPHPEIVNRRFCIEGLLRIDPSIAVPGFGTVEELYKDMRAYVAAQNISFI